MAYATPAELQDYVSASVLLPDESEQERLLDRASELIDHDTFSRIDTNNESHTNGARQATLAQVEYWLLRGEMVDVSGPVSSYSVGSVSENFGGGGAGRQGSAPRLAPRARSALFAAGLLYRGVRSA